MTTPKKTTSRKQSTQLSVWVSRLSFQRWGRVKEKAHAHKSLIDFDEGLRSLREFWKRFRKVCRVIGNRPVWFRYDKTRHGWHVVIWWRYAMQPWEHLALQAILGSDWRREAMNFARLAAGRSDRFSMERWNILYQEKLKCR